MSLEIGTELGSYHILGLLGRGGMGEVYRAKDLRLAREVALKVLPTDFLADEEHLARFTREAQVLATLNHPNIGAIYGLEESNGVRALILELVEGPTLADRIARRALSIDEVVGIARQIAQAVEAAHARGIIHRDLKPSNIKVRADGTTKVLDFGLAKALDATPDGQAASSVTVTRRAVTGEGIVLGTPAYMSPEQARGQSTDERADIWSFGCVLFEMITGRAPFAGNTISDTVAAVLEREPDWRLLPDAMPKRIAWLLRRCLAKDANQRLHHIADARIELDEVLSRQAESSEGVPKGRERLWWTVLVAGLLLLSIALFVGRLRGGDSSRAPSRVYNAAIILPEGVRLAGVLPSGRFALSPDGRFLAMSASDATGRQMLWVRPLESRVAQPIEGTEGAAFPFWAPDSRAIGFQAERKLKKVDVAGGDVVTLCDAPFASGATWNANGVILFTPRGDSSLFRVSSSGGTPVQVTSLDRAAGEVQHSYPFFLPDGQHFLYFSVGTKQGGMTDPGGVFVGSLDSRERGKRLVASASNPQYAEGRILFIRDGTLLAQPFEARTLSLSGDPASLVQMQMPGGLSSTGVPGTYSVSQTGLLTYQAGLIVRSQLTWYDRGGTVLGKLGDEGDYADVALSPTGSRLAVSLLDTSVGTRDLWLFDVARGLRERFTFGGGDNFAPNWSRPTPDHLVFSSRRAGSINLYRKQASGGRGEELFFADELGKFNASFSPDGKYLAYVAGGGVISRSDIWIWPVLGDRKAFAFMETGFIETHPQFSPDGRWLAYTSTESGEFEVYVTSFPTRDGKWRVSTAGGAWPRWNRNGTEVFYLSPGNELISVPFIADTSEVHLGVGRTLFAMHPRPRARLDAYPYDVTPDGQRFIVNTFADEPASSSNVALTINWTAALPRP